MTTADILPEPPENGPPSADEDLVPVSIFNHPVLGSLKGMLAVQPGVDLTEPADPDWGKVYDE